MALKLGGKSTAAAEGPYQNYKDVTIRFLNPGSLLWFNIYIPSMLNHKKVIRDFLSVMMMQI
jgi:hypothetical protein